MYLPIPNRHRPPPFFSFLGGPMWGLSEPILLLSDWLMTCLCTYGPCSIIIVQNCTWIPGEYQKEALGRSGLAYNKLVGWKRQYNRGDIRKKKTGGGGGCVKGDALPLLCAFCFSVLRVG